DQAAIGLVDRGGEQGRGQKLEILVPVDAGLADEGHGLAQPLDHRGQKEIAAELDQVRGLGLIPDGKRPLPIASRRGEQAVTASGAPAATMKSFPAAATSGRPKTDAATKRWPAFA